VLVAYLWGRRAFGVEIGLSAAALTAAAFWTLFTSRMALNSQPLPALYGVAVYALWRLLFDDDLKPAHVAGWAALFGAGLAASLHVYEASRVACLAFPAFAIYLLVTDRARLRRRGLAFGAALLAGIGLAAPHLLDPSAWGRTATLAEPLLALRRGDLGLLLANAWQGLGTLAVRGDPLITYNLPGRPVLPPWLAIFFGVGVVLSIWRWRRPEYAFALLWLGAGIAPTLVIGAFTCTLHSIAAQPVIYTLTALGGVEVARLVARRFGDRAGRIAWTLWLAIIAISGVLSVRDYFRWGELAETRAAYFHTLAEMLDWVNREAPPDSVAVISSPFPDPPLDPYIGLMRLRRDDVDLRWVDGRSAVSLPPVDEVWLLDSSDASLDPALSDRLAIADAHWFEMRPDDTNPAFRVMRLDAETSRARIAEKVKPVGGDAPIFGGALALEGVNLPQAASPGDEIVVTTCWRVVAPDALGPVPPDRFTHEVVIFVQALDATGGYVAGQDVIGVPFASWRAGDGILHVHRLRLPDDTPPGELRLIAGLYVRPEGSRLPVSTGGDFVKLGVVLVH
jgi:hypothetical protein